MQHDVAFAFAVATVADNKVTRCARSLRPRLPLSTRLIWINK